MHDTNIADHSYSVSELIPVFRQAPLSMLVGDLSILAGAPVADEDGYPRRLAFVEIDDLGILELRVQSRGFEQSDLLWLRHAMQRLEEGAEVTISGNAHVIALFSTCVKVRDDKIEEIRFGFEIDPFA